MAVMFPIEEYDQRIEDLADLAVIAERRNEPTIPHDGVIAELERNRRLNMLLLCAKRSSLSSAICILQ
jgi:hypothetical protein